MNKKIKPFLFGVLIIAQLVVPAQMILKREYVLAKGHPVKFITEPVDPYDPFRGKYVQIRVKGTDQIPVSNIDDYKKGQKVYALIDETNGFSQISGISLSKPDTDLYFEAKILYINKAGIAGENGTSGTVSIDIPFKKYYMDETLAPRAEHEYNSMRISGKKIYITVRLESGYAALEKLYIDDTPIEDYLNNKTSTE